MGVMMPMPKAWSNKVFCFAPGVPVFLQKKKRSPSCPYTKAIRKIAIVVANATNQTSERSVPRPERYTAI
jgi:hypothetical protein